MHIFNVVTLVVVLTLVGVEFSVSAVVNPAAWRLEPESQLKMLSRFAFVLGKVMPVWYPVSTVLFVIQTWLCWHTPARAILFSSGCDLGSYFGSVDFRPGATQQSRGGGRRRLATDTSDLGQETPRAYCRSRHRSRPAHIRRSALSGRSIDICIDKRISDVTP